MDTKKTYGVWHDIAKAIELDFKTDCILLRKIEYKGVITYEQSWGAWDSRCNKFCCMEYGSDEGLNIDDVISFQIPTPPNKKIEDKYKYF